MFATNWSSNGGLAAEASVTCRRSQWSNSSHFSLLFSPPEPFFCDMTTTPKLGTKDLLKAQRWVVERESKLLPLLYKLNSLTPIPSHPGNEKIVSKGTHNIVRLEPCWSPGPSDEIFFSKMPYQQVANNCRQLCYRSSLIADLATHCYRAVQIPMQMGTVYFENTAKGFKKWWSHQKFQTIETFEIISHNPRWNGQLIRTDFPKFQLKDRHNVLSVPIA